MELSTPTSIASSEAEVNAKILQKRIQTGKQFVYVIAICMLAITLPQRSFHILWPITISHLAFFWWCDHPDLATLENRYSYSIYLVELNSIMFTLYVHSTKSSVFFERGMACFMAPLAICREANSFIQGVALVVTNSVVLLLCACGHDLFGESAQWLALNVIITAASIDMLRTRLQVEGARKSLKLAHNMFKNIMSFMCDGYFVSDASGHIVAMDQKAANILQADGSAELNLASVIRPLNESFANPLQPGLKLVSLQGKGDQVCEAEMYASSVSSVVFEDALPYIVGRAGVRLKQDAQEMVLCAFRILKQIPAEHKPPSLREERSSELEFGPQASTTCGSPWGASLSQGSVASESKEYPVEDCVASVEARKKLYAHGSAQKKGTMASVSEDSLSDTSESVVISDATSSRNGQSVGWQVDAMLHFMKSPPNEVITKSVNKDLICKQIREMRRHFKLNVQDLLTQTTDQLVALRAMHTCA